MAHRCCMLCCCCCCSSAGLSMKCQARPCLLNKAGCWIAAVHHARWQKKICSRIMWSLSAVHPQMGKSPLEPFVDWTRRHIAGFIAIAAPWCRSRCLPSGSSQPISTPLAGIRSDMRVTVQSRKPCDILDWHARESVTAPNSWIGVDMQTEGRGRGPGRDGAVSALKGQVSGDPFDLPLPPLPHPPCPENLSVWTLAVPPGSPPPHPQKSLLHKRQAYCHAVHAIRTSTCTATGVSSVLVANAVCGCASYVYLRCVLGPPFNLGCSLTRLTFSSRMNDWRSDWRLLRASLITENCIINNVGRWRWEQRWFGRTRCL